MTQLYSAVFEDPYGMGTLVSARARNPLAAIARTAREDALAFVHLLMLSIIPRIAIENPIGCISTRIRKPDQIIQPHQFGDVSLAARASSADADRARAAADHQRPQTLGKSNRFRPKSPVPQRGPLGQTQRHFPRDCGGYGRTVGKPRG